MIACRRCIYDERIPAITFDAGGICNYCRQHDDLDRSCPTGAAGEAILRRMADSIRLEGKGRKYDVVVGVSGGCDSSYLVHLARSLGLRPLAAHYDNTWNSKTAVQNLRRVLGSLEVDLFTHVVDHREQNDLFRAFLRASVPEIDTPTDIGLAVTHYLAARRHGIRTIWEGHSFRTEGISPPGWFYMDARYIDGIHRRFGSVPLRTFPNLWLGRWLRWIVVHRIRKLRPLYYVDYHKLEARELLEKTYGWQWYGGHHMENRSAQFTNNWYLPRKFGIDLRYSELSALVRSGQMTRDEALAKVSEPKPFDEAILAEVKKRLALGDDELEAIMNLPRKSFRDYPTYKRTFERLRPLFWLLWKGGYVPASFYLKYAKNP